MGKDGFVCTCEGASLQTKAADNGASRIRKKSHGRGEETKTKHDGKGKRGKGTERQDDTALEKVEVDPSNQAACGEKCPGGYEWTWNSTAGNVCTCEGNAVVTDLEADKS